MFERASNEPKTPQFFYRLPALNSFPAIGLGVGGIFSSILITGGIFPQILVTGGIFPQILVAGGIFAQILGTEV